MKEIIVAAITAGKTSAEARDYASILKENVNKQRRKKQQHKNLTLFPGRREAKRGPENEDSKKQQRKKRVVTDAADEEDEMQKILSEFFRDIRKLRVDSANEV